VYAKTVSLFLGVYDEEIGFGNALGFHFGSGCFLQKERSGEGG
jgi:hypothetical protein